MHFQVEAVQEPMHDRREQEGGTFDALLVRACARALRAVPRANAAYRDGRFELYRRINVGIVVALPAIARDWSSVSWRRGDGSAPAKAKPARATVPTRTTTPARTAANGKVRFRVPTVLSLLK